MHRRFTDPEHRYIQNLPELPQQRVAEAVDNNRVETLLFGIARGIITIREARWSMQR
jgi:hypothetical protein